MNYSIRLIFIKTFIVLMCLNISACSDKDDLDNTRQLPYSFISQEDLADWDSGIQSEDGYIIASKDENDKSTTYFIKSYNEHSDGIIHLRAIGGLLLRFNSKGELAHILNNKYSINISKKEYGYFIHCFNDKGDLYGSIINTSMPSVSISNTASRSSISSFFSANNINTIINWLQIIESVFDLGEDLFSSDVIGFLTDFSGFSVDLLLGSIPQPIGISLTTLNDIIVGLNNSLYERQKSAMYGNCKICIDEITNDGEGNINCFIVIENANTIPSHLYHLYYNESEAEAQNIVKWGLVANKNVMPRSHYYTEPYYLEERVLDTTNPNKQCFIITFPMPSDGNQYYFTSYLKSYRFADEKDNVNDNLIKYSEVYKYSTFNGYINGFSQLSAKESNGTISFNCSVSGIMKALYDVVEWGFYYRDDYGNLSYFPSKYHIGGSSIPGISNPCEDMQNIVVSFDKSLFNNIGYKEIKLGLYTKGGFNLTYNGFSEPQSFYVEYNNKNDDAIIYHRNPFEFVDLGLSVKWASSNIGAKSIGEPGLYFAWGETSQKSHNTPYDAQHNNFGYPIIDKHGNIISWHYENIGVSICGTNYDAAKMHWGNNSRMPSNANAKELLSKCRFTTGYENGITGRWAIGPNNHAIFFPSGGFPNPTINDVKEHHYNARGWYWTGEIGTEDFPYTISSCTICSHFGGSFFFTSGTSSLGDEYGRSERCMGMNIRAVCPKQ